MRHDLVMRHGATDGFGDVGEADATVHEGFHCDLVGGVQDGGQRAADLAGLARER